MQNQHQSLNTVEAAAYLGVAKKTLEAWRLEKRGPVYCKMGRLVRYPLAELESFRNQNRVLPA